MTNRLTWVAQRIPELRMLVKVAGTLGIGLHVALPRFLGLIFRQGYRPKEIFNLGLLKDAPLISPRLYYSKSHLRTLQLQVNLRRYFSYTEDKLVFYRKCVEHGLATPPVYAVLSRRAGSAAGFTFATTPEGVLQALGPGPSDIAFKPVEGVYGYGLLLLHFAGRKFISSDGTVYHAGDLFTHAAKWPYAEWLLQERLFPHSELAKVSNSQAMQTVRAVTCLDAGGKVHIPFAWFRIINGPSSCDNFHFGLTGNLTAAMDLETGRLAQVFGRRSDQLGLEVLTRHPATGVLFADLRIPYWAEVRNLVETAARAFAPLRTIGWDVAITDSGPALLEGNVTWDPLPTQDDLHRVDTLLLQ